MCLGYKHKAAVVQTSNSGEHILEEERTQLLVSKYVWRGGPTGGSLILDRLNKSIEELMPIQMGRFLYYNEDDLPKLRLAEDHLKKAPETDKKSTWRYAKDFAICAI